MVTAAVDVDRIRHVHVAAQSASHAFRNHRLAVPGRAIQKDRAAGVDRRPTCSSTESSMTRCEKPLRIRSRSTYPRTAASAFRSRT